MRRQPDREANASRSSEEPAADAAGVASRRRAPAKKAVVSGSALRLGRAASRGSARADGDADGGYDASALVSGEVRALRKARRMTLHELGKLSGLSIAFLSQIERGNARPSISALNRVSKALGVSLSWFCRPPAGSESEERRSIVRRAERRRMTYDTGLVDELLSPHLRGRFSMFLTRLEPGATSGGTIAHREGEHGGVVLSGRLDLTIDGAHYRLREGDSFHFDSSTPHSYANPGREATRIVWIVSPPNC